MRYDKPLVISVPFSLKAQITLWLRSFFSMVHTLHMKEFGSHSPFEHDNIIPGSRENECRNHETIDAPATSASSVLSFFRIDSLSFLRSRSDFFSVIILFFPGSIILIQRNIGKSESKINLERKHVWLRNELKARAWAVRSATMTQSNHDECLVNNCKLQLLICNTLGLHLTPQLVLALKSCTNSPASFKRICQKVPTQHFQSHQ